MSGLQLEPKIKLYKLNDPTVAGTSEVASASLDRQGFQGFIVFSAFGTAAAGNNAKLQESSDNSTFHDIAGSKIGDANNKNVVIACHEPQSRYYLIDFLRGTSSTIGDVWVLLYGGMTEPQVNLIANSQALASLISPAQGTA